jgi:hypothetical protein
MTTITGIDIFTLRQVRDPLDEAAGWPILHPYIEIVYGSILGPTGVQMARMLDRMHRPEGRTLVDVSEIADVLGVKPSVARHAHRRHLDHPEESPHTAAGQGGGAVAHDGSHVPRDRDAEPHGSQRSMSTVAGPGASPALFSRPSGSGPAVRLSLVREPNVTLAS